jgi:hypothetical protein
MTGTEVQEELISTAKAAEIIMIEKHILVIILNQLMMLYGNRFLIKKMHLYY